MLVSINRWLCSMLRRVGVQEYYRAMWFASGITVIRS